MSVRRAFRPSWLIVLAMSAGCGVDGAPLDSSQEVLANDGSCDLDDGTYVVGYAALTGDCDPLPVDVLAVHNGRGFRPSEPSDAACEETTSCDNGSLIVTATCSTEASDAKIEIRKELSFDVMKRTGVLELRVLDSSSTASCQATYSVEAALQSDGAGMSGGGSGGASGEGGSEAGAGGSEAGAGGSEAGSGGSGGGGSGGDAGDEPDPPHCESNADCDGEICADGTCVAAAQECGPNEVPDGEGGCTCVPGGYDWEGNEIDCVSESVPETGCHVVAQNYEETYLGAVGDCDDPESICNDEGMYGAGGADSIFNPNGMFGRAYGPYSAFGEYAYAPPQLVCDGEIQGCVTVNTTACAGEPINPATLCNCP